MHVICRLVINALILHIIVIWEPEGCYYFSTIFYWEPEGHYRHWFCTAIVPFWFSTEHRWKVITPFWLSTDITVLSEGGDGVLDTWILENYLCRWISETWSHFMWHCTSPFIDLNHIIRKSVNEPYTLLYYRLRARRVLMLFNDVLLRTRRGLFTIGFVLYSNNTLLVINGTSLSSVYVFLALNWRYLVRHIIHVLTPYCIPLFVITFRQSQTKEEREKHNGGVIYLYCIHSLTLSHLLLFPLFKNKVKLCCIHIRSFNNSNVCNYACTTGWPRKNATPTINNFKKTREKMKELCALMRTEFFSQQNDTKIINLDEGVLILWPFFWGNVIFKLCHFCLKSHNRRTKYFHCLAPPGKVSALALNNEDSNPSMNKIFFSLTFFAKIKLFESEKAWYSPWY